MPHKSVIVAIRPHYANKIMEGTKRVEFRRLWAARPVSKIVIYATAPVQRIVGIARVKNIHIGSKDKLWDLAKRLGGGLSKRELFTYMAGKDNGVAIELAGVRRVAKGIDIITLFGKKFKPPQSFRYIKEEEYIKLEASTLNKQRTSGRSVLR